MSKAKPDSYVRSYKAIIDYVLNFCLSRVYEGADTEYPRTRGSICGFAPTDFSGPPAQVGDLILLTSANAGNFRLSWLKEVEDLSHGDKRYLCESIESGELCWWSNVGISYLHRKTLEQHPEWRWTDEQWAFKDRWWKVCYKWHDAYIYKPCYPEFDGNSVKLQVYMRHGLSPNVAERTEPNFKKVTLKKLSELYQAMVNEQKSHRAPVNEPTE